MKNDTHRDIQERLLNKMIFVFGIITIPVLSFSLLRFFSIGWKPVFNIHIFIAVMFLFFSIYRESIFYHIKVGTLVAIFCLLAIFSALNLGMMGFLVGFLMLSVFIGMVFWGRKPAIIIYLGGTIIILSIGILTVKGIIYPNTDIANYTKLFSSWITTIVGFSLIVGLTILIVGEIGYMLAHKITEIEKVNQDLQKAHDEIKTLNGMLPICSHCKNIRDDSGYWNQIEDYISKHSEAKFSHSICKKCAKKHYPDFDLYEEQGE